MTETELIEQRVRHLVEQGGAIDPAHEALCNRRRYLRRTALRVFKFVIHTSVALMALGFVLERV